MPPRVMSFPERMRENDAVPTDLTLYSRPAATVFGLLGEGDNDITY